MEDPTTRELRAAKAREEAEERRLAERTDPDDERKHERRAERAAYLRQKLEERAAAEQDADEEGS